MRTWLKKERERATSKFPVPELRPAIFVHCIDHHTILLGTEYSQLNHIHHFLYTHIHTNTCTTRVLSISKMDTHHLALAKCIKQCDTIPLSVPR